MESSEFAPKTRRSLHHSQNTTSEHRSVSLALERLPDRTGRSYGKLLVVEATKESMLGSGGVCAC
jgi:hypothetical protein